MTRLLTLVSGRRGLWFLAFAPLFLLAGLFLGGSGSLSGSSGSAAVGDFDEVIAAREGPSSTTVEVSAVGTSWNDLPGFLTPQQPGFEFRQIPRPDNEDILVSTLLEGGSVGYQIDYGTGAHYEAEVRPNGTTVYNYSPPPPALGAKVLRAAIIAVGIVFAGLGLFSLASVFTQGDPEATRLAHGINVAPLGQHLVERWLRRSRWYRFAGASAGVAVGVAAGELSVAFYLAVTGIAIGGALSELHLLRRRPSTTSMAGLTARRMTDYTERRDIYALGSVAIASLTVGMLTVVADSRRPFVLAALLVVGATLWFQHRVVSRSRPAIRHELTTADDLLRYLAATQGFARPAIALGFFLVSLALSDDTASVWFGRAALVPLLVGFIWLFIGRQSRIPQMAARVIVS